MDVLKSITQPTHVIITNISTAHIENFENKSQLIKEKEKLIIENNTIYYKEGNIPTSQKKIVNEGQQITFDSYAKKELLLFHSKTKFQPIILLTV